MLFALVAFVFRVARSIPVVRSGYLFACSHASTKMFRAHRRFLRCFVWPWTCSIKTAFSIFRESGEAPSSKSISTDRAVQYVFSSPLFMFFFPLDFSWGREGARRCFFVLFCFFGLTWLTSAKLAAPMFDELLRNTGWYLPWDRYVLKRPGKGGGGVK